MKIYYIIGLVLIGPLLLIYRHAVPSKSLALKSPISKAVNNRVWLDNLARDTWMYLSSDWATDNHLPWSWRSAQLVGGDFANPAEIGLYAVSWLAAYDMQQSWSPNWSETETEVVAVLDQLRAWQTGYQTSQPNGPNAYQSKVFYQWYWINWNPPVVGGGMGDHVVPSIDNAWMAAALITIRSYGQINNHVSLESKANEILEDMDFSIWYNNANHLFTLGDFENPSGGGDADYYSNENRLINFVAFSLGHISREEFQNSLEALVQTSGIYNDITVSKMAWDGSYFTYGAPGLFIQEMDTQYGEETVLTALQAQILYSEEQGYLAWGLSDTYDIGTGGYIQQGSPPVAASGLWETHPGVISPHASAFALFTPLASEAFTNLQSISNTFPTAYHSNYGFYDSVMTKLGDPNFGEASQRFSALNQEWIFLSLANARSEFIWRYFYQDIGVFQAHSEMYGFPSIYLPIILYHNQEKSVDRN